MLLAVGGHVLQHLEPQAVRMAGSLAGGLGGTHEEMCGALSGGALVIGGLLGRTSAGKDDKPAMALTAQYRTAFLAEFGDTQCARLREQVYSEGGMGSCAILVERAVLMLLDTLRTHSL